jgi:hypothetical protein
VTGVYGDVVVGSYQISENDFHSFIYHDGIFTDLMMPPTTPLTFATGIYGNEVVGFYQDLSGNDHGFTATDSSLPAAVPEPSMLGGALVVSLTGIIRRRRA